MSKILSASCLNGVVSFEGVPVPDVTVLSKGVAASTGVLILDNMQAYYIPTGANDLDTTLGKIIAVIEKIADALTKATEAFEKAVAALNKLDTAAFLIGATAGVPSPPLAATDIAAITSAKSVITTKVSELNTIKTEIQNLKAALQ